MNQKRFINIAIIIGIVVIVGIAGYFGLSQRTTTSPVPTPTPTPLISTSTTLAPTPTSKTSVTPTTTPKPQTKIAIHCKSEESLSPTQRDVQSPLVIGLSLTTPCPLNDGMINGTVTTNLYGNAQGLDVKTIEVRFVSEGNISVVGSKIYTINDIVFNRPMTKDIALRIMYPGMGSLTVGAAGISSSGNSNGLLGSSDEIFFLLASDGEFIVSRSSYFELERAKLSNDLRAGLIDKSKYDVEFRKMLEGKHTYVCSQITCY